MKKVLKLLVMSVLLTVAFTSCDDDDPSFDKKPFANTELLSILKTKGFTVEAGMLVMDSKVTEAKTLDLSGTKLADFTGLELFPNLTELNLSNNDYKVTFDFAKLPANIKSVDLSNNKLYEFKGLATVDFEAGTTTNLRKMDKIVFPTSAKYNVETLPFYFKEKACADMQMQNKDGKAEKYTTLREIPDENVHRILKEVLGGKFVGDKFDIAKPFALEKENITIVLDNYTKGAGQQLPHKELTPKTLEGIQYILNDNRFAGGFSIRFDKVEPVTKGGLEIEREDESLEYYIEYIKIGRKCKMVELKEITTDVLDLSQAKSLSYLVVRGNKKVKTIDISQTSMFKKGVTGVNVYTLNFDFINIIKCPKLENIVLPDFSKINEHPIGCYEFLVRDCPSLKSKLDLSKVEVMIWGLEFKGLDDDWDVVYPNIAYLIDQDGSKDNKGGFFNLYVDEKIASKKSTQDFIKKTYLRDGRLVTTHKYTTSPALRLGKEWPYLPTEDEIKKYKDKKKKKKKKKKK